MSFMPSLVRPWVHSRAYARIVPIAAMVLIGSATLQGCQPGEEERKIAFEQCSYPPPPQIVQVLALGNLRADGLPSKTEAQLAEFFFGAAPEPGLGLVKPVSVATNGAKLLICDSAMNAVLQWDSANRCLTECVSSDRPQRPIVVRTAPNGDFLVVDVGQDVVLRFSPDGSLVRRYSSPDESFRPA